MLCLVALSGSAIQAQEALPRDEALKAAFALCRDLPKMLGTPIPTDPDVKRPVAIHADSRGLMVLPETRLSLDVLAKSGPDAVSIGQLWLLKIVPSVDGRAVKADRLQIVTIKDNEKETAVALCALGIRKTAEGRLELLVYGKEKQPLLHVPLANASGKQENPIEIAIQPEGDGATVTLNILGHYTASVSVGLSE
jgi:hypothetical protein